MAGQFTTTQDGSISLQDFSMHAAFKGESMHSAAGALSESIYVYLPCLKNSLAALPDESASLSVCTVGLGLGYLEMITAAAIASSPTRKGEQLRLTSYESNLELIDSLCQWLSGREEDSIYSRVSSDVAAHFGIHQSTLVQFLRKLFLSGRWNFAGPLNDETLGAMVAH